MAGDSANAVLSVIAEKVITPVVDAIGRQFGYLFFYKSNIKNLEKKVTQLENSRDDVDSFFKAQSQNNEEITQSGAGWLKDVEKATMAAKEVLKAKDQLKGWCLNLKTRYVLSRKSTKLVAKIQELDDQAPKRGATNPPHPAGMLPGSSSNVASKDFKTRKEIMDKVMEALTDDRINIIGICGLGGIGKTTILHEVRERARTQKLFDEVAMTTVSQDINMSKIQSDLAGMLGLTRIKDEENIIARADLLHKRLTNGSRILVVLDDVWSEIKLEDVGIPVGNGRARCKVVLASRIQSVCTNMGAQKTIPVGVLSKEEAWHMFKKTTGDCVEREKLEDIAKEVADECGGLPIALLTLAKALSNKRREAWEDARRQLRQSCGTSIPGMSKEVYLSLKLSYDFLEKELPEAQPLLLICCQHPEDAEIEVEKLTRYCLALELFKNVDKVEDARNRTYAVIEHLSSCFLLQAVDVDEEEKDLKCETVKMHDVVRDVCLSIVSEVKDNVCMHIMAQDIDCGYDLGTSKVDYSKLKLLMNAPLDGNLLDISFLQQMKELRVFESISEEYDQPPPLQVLANLRMLSLEHESLSEEITSTIGSLSRLEILSFWASSISSFPSQIRPLSNLKLLDLRCEEGGGLIPSGILPGLNKLEVLYMGNFFLLGAAHKDNQKNRNGEKSHGCITELDSLSNLTTLQIMVDPRDLQDLQRFSFDKLKSFFFGFFRDSNEDYYFSRYRWCPVVEKTIKWGNLAGTKWVSGANIQLIATSTLDLQLNDIDDWIDPLIILEKFVSLKKLELIRCKQLEYIIPEGSLGELLVLSLNNMPVMRHLWVGPTDPLCLLNLREVVIVKCPAIESLFPQSAAKCLVQLRKLEVDDCLLLEEIFSKGESAGTTTTSRGAEIRKEPPNDFTIQFPKLEMLKLWKLPKLGVFYNFEHDDGSVQQSLFNPLVMLPSLKKLDCSFMHQLKQIVGGGMLIAASDDDWLQNLENVTVKGCDSLETVFDFERPHLHSINGMGENADHVLTLLGGLKSVDLMHLPKLEHLCRQIPQGIHAFQNLVSLRVYNCDSLGYLISSSMAHMLVNLQSLLVWQCKSMKEVIKMINEDCGGAKKIVFPSLRKVKLDDLENLSSFFCSSDQQEFFNPLVMLPSLQSLSCYGMHQPKQIVGGGMLYDWLQNLEYVIVEWCVSLETVFDFERLHLHSINGMGENADRVLTLLGGLKYVTLQRLPKLEHLCRQIPQGIHAFQNLISLVVQNCNSLGYLISSPMAHMLVNLQTLSVMSCTSMKQVVKMINEDCGGVKKIVFPSLRVVKLGNLENLSSFFCSSDQQEFFNPLVMLPSLMYLRCKGMHQLKQIVGGGMLIAASDDDWLQNLEDVTVKWCDSLKTVFDFERLHLHPINGMGENADHVLTLLGGLKYVTLQRLPKLEHLCRQIPQGIHAFKNLISLHVYKCDSLGYLISSSMAHMLVNLQSLNVTGCESMKEVIKINENYGMKEIVFHSLSEVILKDLEKLSSFCSSDQQAFEFPSLGEVVIVDCLEMNTFCCGHVTAEKLHGVKPSDHANDDELVWKGDLNETVRHLNERNKVNQMNSDMEEDDVPEEGIADEYAECTKEGQGTPMKALMPLSVASSPNASLTPDVVSHSPPVSDNNNEELANSSSPDLGSVTLPPLIEFVPSASMEQSLHSSDSPVQPKTDKELSDMSFSSRDDDWKRSRILIQGVYVEAKLKTTFEEILTAKPNFLSGLRLKLAKMKTDIIESAIRSLQILRHSNALTISLEELAFIKDSLDDLETSGLDTAWLEKGYQRAILVMKEQKVVSAAAELVTLEREKTEDAAAFELARAAFEMARAKLEASTARRDAFKAEFGALMQEELTAGKELFAGGFDLETSLGDGLLD